MKKSIQKRTTATTTTNGAKDFREFVYQTEPEWSVYAIEAPLEKVAEQLAKLLHGTIVSNDILDGSLSSKGHDIARITPLLSVHDSPWTVAYRTVGFYMPTEADAANKHAQALSRSLKTRAISYHREAVSGESAYEMFEKGKDSGEDISDDEPADDKMIDILFRTLGLYVPACLLYPHGDKIVFEVKPISAKMVSQAWLVEGGCSAS